jgi:hypothetical protein
MRRIIIGLALLVGCGEVKDGRQLADAPRFDSPNDDATPEDATEIDAMIDAPMIDAAPVTMNLTSTTMMPAGTSTIFDFSTAELTGFSVTSTGCSMGFGGTVTGNVDAPSGGTFCGISSTTSIALFTFATPIHAAGISAMDIDFGNDNIVNVTVKGFDAADVNVVTHTRGVTPANTGAEEDNGSLFIGWTTTFDVTRIRVTINQANSTKLDNLIFKH